MLFLRLTPAREFSADADSSLQWSERSTVALPGELKVHILSMKILSRLTLLLFIAMPALQAQAQVPAIINYQGRVTVGTVNFNGQGGFKFSLVSGDAQNTTTYWSNDGTGAAGSQPAHE